MRAQVPDFRLRGVALPRSHGKIHHGLAPGGERVGPLTAALRVPGSAGEIPQLFGVNQPGAGRAAQQAGCDLGTALETRNGGHAPGEGCAAATANGPVNFTFTRRLNFQASHSPMPMMMVPRIFWNPPRTGAASASTNMKA